MFFSLFFYLSIFFYPSIILSSFLFHLGWFVSCLSMNLSIYLYVYIYLFLFYLFVCLSVYLYIYLFFYLFLYVQKNLPFLEINFAELRSEPLQGWQRARPFSPSSPQVDLLHLLPSRPQREYINDRSRSACAAIPAQSTSLTSEWRHLRTSGQNRCCNHTGKTWSLCSEGKQKKKNSLKTWILTQIRWGLYTKRDFSKSSFSVCDSFTLC